MNTDTKHKEIYEGQEAFDLIHALSELSLKDLAQELYILFQDKRISNNEITVLDFAMGSSHNVFRR